jgi:hypothetical protein
MASNAEHQRACRQRHKQRVEALEAELKAAHVTITKLEKGKSAREPRERRPRSAPRAASRATE